VDPQCGDTAEGFFIDPLPKVLGRGSASVADKIGMFFQL
jgi:hypothetical protein